MSPTTPRANRRAFASLLRRAMTAKYGPKARGTQLAEDAGLSNQTVSRWLNEGADPTPEKLRLIAPVLGIPLAEWLAVAEIVPADDIPADSADTPTTPADAIVDSLRRQAKDLLPQDLEELEAQALQQIGMLEEYIRIKVENMRNAAETTDRDNGADAS